MASPAAPPVVSSLSSGPGANRTGWGRGSEPGSALRGTSSRGGRGGSRGGRGARGGRSTNREPSTRSETSGAKSTSDQTKEKTPSQEAKPPPPPATSSAPRPTPNNPPPAAASKASTRSRNPRKPSEQTIVRKPSTTGPETSTSSQTSQTPANATNGPGRASSRRKRSQTKSAPPPAPIAVPKQTLSARSSRSQLSVEKSTPASKDAPPHLQPPPTPSAASVKSDVDALVEHVRSIAMDRPFTPGSHIDWASDDDDSLPDLPDWGLPAAPGGRGSIISPILEDALRPLPSLDPVTPILVVSEAQQDNAEGVAAKILASIEPAKEAASQSDQSSSGTDVSFSDQPETDTAPSDVSEAALKQPEEAKFEAVMARVAAAATTAGKTTKGPTLRSPEKAHNAKGSAKHEPSKRHPEAAEAPSKNTLTGSMHAPEKAATAVHPTVQESIPEDGLDVPVPSPSKSESAVPARPLDPLSPTQARSRPVGRFGHRQFQTASQSHIPDRHLGSERLSRHARNHSTPPTGPGTAHAHARTLHARPVITGDAITRLARTLGGAMPKREPAAAKE